MGKAQSAEDITLEASKGRINLYGKPLGEEPPKRTRKRVLIGLKEVSQPKWVQGAERRIQKE